MGADGKLLKGGAKRIKRAIKGGKNGRELHGAARTSFMAKCKREACAPKAIGSDGKALKGAAKKSFMDKCLREQA